MYDFTELVTLAEATIENCEKREQFRKTLTDQLKSEGMVIITHTGGGNQIENRVLNAETDEVLAILPDTHEAFQEAWKDEWAHEDGVYNEIYDKYPPIYSDKYISNLGGMPEGMLNALVEWIENTEDMEELKEFVKNEKMQV